MLSRLQHIKSQSIRILEDNRKTQLGQFFTPNSIADFMANLFRNKNEEHCFLLDPGAGCGALSIAFLRRLLSGSFKFKSTDIYAFEIDENLHSSLEHILETYKEKLALNTHIRTEDFIHSSVNSINAAFFSEVFPKFTHCILNPPYKKIRSDSYHRTALRSVGIETVNLYSAFVALSLLMLNHGGELVAIIPRSFCNGLYYKPFREFILKTSAIQHIHLFKSRNKAFAEDSVLQENVIIYLIKGGQQKNVTITTSTDGNFDDIKKYEYAFHEIVTVNDPEKFIHIPTHSENSNKLYIDTFTNTLKDIGIEVSTGPIVDFRLEKYLQKMPDNKSVPLLYPGHFKNWKTHWPINQFKKSNAIIANDITQKWFYPNGFYCIVRRFSSKEEKRRIVASIINPSDFPGIKMLGFENHLNVFHISKEGLPKELAFGLFVYLNSTAIDNFFRQFNGHTQVNATDLRTIRYPDINNLYVLGQWAIEQSTFSQELIDKKLESLINERQNSKKN